MPNLIYFKTELSKILDYYPLRAFYNELGNNLADFGFWEYALDIYNESFEFVKSNDEKIKILICIGSVYSDQGYQEKAIETYSKAISEFIPDYEAYDNLATSYSLILDYTNAITCEENALKYTDKSSDLYKTMKERLYYFTKMKSKFLNIHKIKDKQLKDIIYSAEKEFINQMKPDTKYEDLSGIIQKYSKFIELILDKNIARPFLDLVTRDSTKIYYHNFQEKILFDFIKKGKKNITLGPWQSLLKFEENTGDLYNKFENFVDGILNKEQKTIIKELSEKLTPIRNDAMHKTITTKEEFLKFKEDLISLLNDFLSINWTII